jgi:hypothetical protein
MHNYIKYRMSLDFKRDEEGGHIAEIHPFSYDTDPNIEDSLYGVKHTINSTVGSVNPPTKKKDRDFLEGMKDVLNVLYSNVKPSLVTHNLHSTLHRSDPGAGKYYYNQDRGHIFAGNQARLPDFAHYVGRYFRDMIREGIGKHLESGQKLGAYHWHAVDTGKEDEFKQHIHAHLDKLPEIMSSFYKGVKKNPGMSFKDHLYNNLPKDSNISHHAAMELTKYITEGV